MDKNKIKSILKYLFPVLILLLSWVIAYFSGKSESGLIIAEKPLIQFFLIAIFLVSVFLTISILIRYNRILKELKQTESFVNNINSEKYNSDDLNVTIPIIKSINRAIKDVAESKKNQLSELRLRTRQLHEINTELNDAYIQLESSYAELENVLEQLNESEKRYHSLVVNIPDIILTIDPHGNIAYANRACRVILKFRRRDIVGKPFQHLIHPSAIDKFSMDKLRYNIKRRGRYYIDIPLRTKDGSLILTEIKFTETVESPETDCIQAIIRDVTEQKRIEQAIAEANHRLKILNSFNHKLASTMELQYIYRQCVSIVTGELGFLGCIIFGAGKNDRYYKIMDYSGDYFKQPGNLEQFYNIRCSSTLFSGKTSEGIVLKQDMLFQYLVLNNNKSVAVQEAGFSEVFIHAFSSHEKRHGMLMVFSEKGFTQEEIETFRSIGNSIAVAVEKTIHLIESQNNFIKTIDALVAAIEARDQYTKGHSQRVSALAVKIANKMGMNKQQVEELRIAGILHDIGKVGISDRILLKKGPLTKEEYDEIKKHPAISNRILHSIGLPDRILKAVAFHHERYDGGGYPFGLTNESLGYEPQIIAVADAFDAMTTLRPYKKPMSWQMAVLELERCKGSQFNPEIVDIMVRIIIEGNADDEPFEHIHCIV